MSDKRMDRMPDIQWGGNTDYDTLAAVLETWVVIVRMTDNSSFFHGEVLGLTYPNKLKLALWDEEPGMFDHDNPISVGIDYIKEIIIQ